MIYIYIYVIGLILGLFIFGRLHGYFNPMVLLESIFWPVIALGFIVVIPFSALHEWFEEDHNPKYRGVSYHILYRDGEYKFMSKNKIFDSMQEMKDYIDDLYNKQEIKNKGQ